MPGTVNQTAADICGSQVNADNLFVIHDYSLCSLHLVFPAKKFYGFISDDWLCPEPDAQDKSQCQVKKTHSAAQPDMIAQPANHQWNNRASYNASNEDAREGSMVFIQRIKRQRKNNRVHHRCKKSNQWKCDE